VRIAVVVSVAALAGVGGGLALHELTTSPARASAPAVPELHGQAVWRPGELRAPAFTLRDQHDRAVSLASLRGRTVVLTFLDSRCRQECPLVGRTLGSVMRRLAPADRPVLVIVSVNPADNPLTAGLAARHWALAGDWHWLLGTRAQLAPVWRAYRITVEPKARDVVHSAAVYLIDRRGYERAGYLFPFLPGFVQGDLRRLAHEPA
jgi:protein SCO1